MIIMVNKLLIQLLLSCLFTGYTIAQESLPKYIIGLESQFLVGGETNASYDFLIGGRGNYFLERKKRFDIFLSAGFATDVFNADSRLISGDIQLGTFWNYENRLSLFASFGGHYMYESHSLILIEDQRNWQNSIIGITASAGVNFKLVQFLRIQLFFKQTNLDFSAVGIGLNYSL